MLLNSLSFPMGITLGDTTILLHVVFETLGIFIGFRYFLWLKKRKGDAIEQTNRVWILIGATFGALIGSRLLGAFENPDALMAAKNPIWYAFQQKTMVGGLLGGLWSVEFTKHLLKEKQRSGDLFVYPMLLAMIIGRLGCFSMGVHEETYGLATNLPWGMDLGDGQHRHPVALYEIVFLLLLWAATKYWNKNHTWPAGKLFRYFMVAYCAFRFGLDFIKPHYTYPIGLSAIQIACLLGLLWYSPFLLPGKQPDT